MARETIFIIDTSGSMHGVSIEQARKALLLALGGLGPEDRFNVIQFNSVTHGLFPVSVPATTANLDHARDYVQRLEANGGTEMRPALEKALHQPAAENHLRQIIFITDGSVGNEDELFSLIEKRLGNTRLFTVGIGSAPNGWFMRKAAESGRGSFTYISALHEIDEKMGALFEKLENPQLTDIVVQWPDGVQFDAYPRKVADLYAGEPVIVKAKASGEFRRNSRITVRGNSVGGAWTQVLDIEEGRNSAGVAAVWARARIEALFDRNRGHGVPDSARAEVVDTAIRYHLVSKYTSLVAVDKTPVRPKGAGLDSEQVPNLLAYGQSTEAIFGFPATATPAEMQRLVGIACLLLALGIFMVGRSRRVHPVAA
jgi:Ca-activated chloride channel family protein